MPNSDFSIDLHAQATYKYFGKSLQNNADKQSSSVNDKTTLWYYNPPSLSHKLLNFIGSPPKFSQPYFIASAYGRHWGITIGLGIDEKCFLTNKFGRKSICYRLCNFTSELGKQRINVIQGMQDYFEDLKQELSFLQQMHNKPETIAGKCAQSVGRNTGFTFCAKKCFTFSLIIPMANSLFQRWF